MKSRLCQDLDDAIKVRVKFGERFCPFTNRKERKCDLYQKIEYHYAECHYAECHYAECRGALHKAYIILLLTVIETYCRAFYSQFKFPS